MTQKFTIIFDLDGTLIDTAPDLMNAHNFVMRKFGYETKTTEDIRKLVGKGAGSLIGRSVWGQAKKEFGKVNNDHTKKEMPSEFIKYYADNIANEMVDMLLADINAVSGARMSVLVNSLGATPQEALYILYRIVKERLEDIGVKIVMPLVGRYAPSMEMTGVSFTFCELDSELEDLLLEPANCAFWNV